MNSWQQFHDRERDHAGRIQWEESDFFSDDKEILQPEEINLINDVAQVRNIATSIYKRELERSK